MGRLRVIQSSRSRGRHDKVGFGGRGGVIADEVADAVVLCQKPWCTTDDLLRMRLVDLWEGNRLFFTLFYQADAGVREDDAR